MKKLIASALFALLGTGAFAQTAPGTVVVSGSVGFSLREETNEVYKYERNTFSYHVSPGVGYMLRDGLEAGVSLGFSHEKSKDSGFMYSNNGMPYTSEVYTNDFSISPYVKKYFMFTEKIGLTGVASASFSTGKRKYDYASDYTSITEEKRGGFSIGVAPGITFFPTEKIGISASLGRLGYTRTSSKTGEDDARKSTSSDFGLSLNSSSLYFGLSYYISR